MLWGWHGLLFIMLFQAHVASRVSVPTDLTDFYPPTSIRSNKAKPFALRHAPFNLSFVPVMHIKKLKVRPQKSTCTLQVTLPISPFTLLPPPFCATFEPQELLFIAFFVVIDPPVVLCGPQLASMLGCWAATKDVKSVGACREHAQALFECMRTAVRLLLFDSFRGRELIFLVACDSR